MQTGSPTETTKPLKTSGKDGKRLLRGSCLCGGVVYTITIEENPTVNNCHCTDCRKFHGAAFGTAIKALTWDIVDQGQCFQSFAQENCCRRYFCRQCGSSLAFQSAPPNDTCMFFAMAALDMPAKEEESAMSRVVQPTAHIFVCSKVPWLDLPDDALPRYKRDRTSELTR